MIRELKAAALLPILSNNVDSRKRTRTEAATCVISSQPAAFTAGPLNLVQMSRSPRFFLFLKLTGKVACQERHGSSFSATLLMFLALRMLRNLLAQKKLKNETLPAHDIKSE